MKIAVCHYSYHRTWEAEAWDCAKLAGVVKELEVEGIDFHVRYLDRSRDTHRKIKSILAAAELELSGISLSNDFNQEDPSELRRQIDTVKYWLAFAADAGAPVSRVFGGHLKNRNDEKAFARGMDLILKGLEAVTREAEKRAVVLALENHGGLPCRAEDQVATIERIGSPHLRATIDVGNYLQCGQEPSVATRIAGPHAAYVHFKDFTKRKDGGSATGYALQGCVVGEGVVDHEACVAALEECGYQGFLALEYEGREDERDGVWRSVARMKSILS